MPHTSRRTIGWIGPLIAAGLILTFTGMSITPSAAAPTPAPPTSAAPTSVAPTSAPPTSVAPTSVAPTSAPPTSAPATPSPSATPTPTPTPTPAPVPAEGAIPWWLWLIVAAAVVGGAVAIILRTNVDRSWDRRFETVSGELTWIHDQVIPQLLESPTAASAAQLWNNAKARVATVEAELRSLGTAGVSQKRTMRATHLRRLLASVTIAVEAEVSLPPEATTDQLREAQRKLRLAQADLREGLDNGGTPPPAQRVAR